jgi:hypothetical protein
MAAILSEITKRVNVSAIKDRLTEVYANVNDTVIKVKEVIADKLEGGKLDEGTKENKKEGKQESYAPPPAEKTTKDKIFDFLTKLKDYFIIAGMFLLKIMFYVYLASLVANDMMMYAPVIRAFFFVFTLIVTYTFSAYAFFLTCYYLLRRGYDYYHQNLSSEPVKPPISFPMIFAILPLTTYYPESAIARFFLWAFMYQKSDKPERVKKENDRLEVIMTEYWKDLNKSFDYLNKVKDKEPFGRLYTTNEMNLTVKHMHPIQKPDTVVEPTNATSDEQVNKDATNKAAPFSASMASFAAAAAAAFNPAISAIPSSVHSTTPGAVIASAPPAALVGVTNESPPLPLTVAQAASPPSTAAEKPPKLFAPSGSEQ